MLLVRLIDGLRVCSKRPMVMIDGDDMANVRTTLGDEDIPDDSEKTDSPKIEKTDTGIEDHMSAVINRDSRHSAT